MDSATVLSFVGIVIAINGAFTAGAFFYYNQSNEKKQREIDALSLSNKRLSEIVESLITNMLADDVRERTYETVLERLLSVTNHDDDITKRILLAFAKNSRETSRAINELMLFSEDPLTKISAYRQLSEICGTVDSIERMLSAKELEPKDDIDYFEECITVLKKRIRINSLT